MYKDEHVAAWSRIVAFVKQNGRAKIGVQLAHARSHRMIFGLHRPGLMV